MGKRVIKTMKIVRSPLDIGVEVYSIKLIDQIVTSSTCLVD